MNVKRLTNETIIYGAGKAIEGAAAFVVLPFIGRFLPPSDLGVADIIAATVGLLHLTIGLNLHQALTRYFYDVDRKTLATTHAVALLANGLIQLFMGLGLIIAFSGRALDPIAWAGGLMMVVMHVLMEHVSTMFRLRHEPFRYLVVVLVAMTLWCIATPMLLVVFDAGIKSIFFGKLFAFAIAVLICSGWLARMYAPRINMEYLRLSLRLVVPTLPGTLAAWGLLHGPRFFLDFGAGSEEVGYYGVAVRFSYMLSLTGVSGLMAWAPFAMGIKDKDNADVTLGRGLLYYFAMNSIIAVLIAAFAREEVWLLMGVDYLPAVGLVGPMLVGTLFFNLGLALFVQVSIAERTIWQSIGYALGFVVMALLNIYLIPQFASLGAVLAAIAGQLTSAVTLFIAGQRFFPVRIDYRRLIGLTLILVFVVVVSRWIDGRAVVLSVKISSKVCLVLSGWGFIALILGRSELRASRSLIANMLGIGRSDDEGNV
jgi:O-antigen/teichoic acid export membrane protein